MLQKSNIGLTLCYTNIFGLFCPRVNTLVYTIRAQFSSRPRVDTIGIRDGYCRSYADSSSYCHALEQPFERIVKRILKGFACKQACGRTSGDIQPVAAADVVARKQV